MNTTISGKMQYLNDIEIIKLNDHIYEAFEDFHIKLTDELRDVLINKKPYINKVTFYHVNSYNSGEASFIYDNEYIFFVIYNIESSIESTYAKKGIIINYNIKKKELSFSDLQTKEYVMEKYKEQFDIKEHILDEIDMLMLRKTNSIHFKHSMTDVEKKNHVIEVKGKFVNTNQIIIYLYDITKEEELISKAFQAEKLQALGNMSGAIAHELNNQLMAIDGNIELCCRNLNIKENTYLNNALKASENASSLIKSLLSYSSKDQVQFEKINVEDLFDELTNKINIKFNKDVEFIKNYKDEMARVTVYGSKILLIEALNNIITNSIESFDKPDHILIMNAKVTYLNSCPRDAVNSVDYVNGKYLQIDIIDNGCGIPYDVSKRIFDPFYTTKDKFSKSGLGLTQALGTIIKHNGILSMYSCVKHGTTMRVYLPCKEDKMQLSFDLFVDKPKILVVDDDDVVREVLELMLKDLGYDVISSKNPYEAISIFDINKDNIDLVISDMIMPKMNGKELFYKLKEFKKNLKFVLLSGYTKNNLDQKFLSEIKLYLEKPIRRDLLENEIKKCLK